ncbi:unnamed protein product, partial [Mesorhabditis belari]|uniref:C-type lectin domain-containing protein n=1 Tax=Mesorhabditis belari TaxID=2138241 RepID=A0AAF3EC92_9BILA
MQNFLFFISYLFFSTKLACGHCPKNGIKEPVDGSCYFGINFNETFSGADNFCSTYFYGNLASITSAVDDSNVLDLARGFFKDAKNVWLGGTYDGSKIQWLDGSPDIYRNFVAGTQPGKIVLDLVNGNWSTATWNAILPFICLEKDEKDDVKTTTTPAAQLTTVPKAVTTPAPPTCPKESPCPPEWVYSSTLQSCYKAIYGTNYQQAADQCTSMDSTLASIRSDEENRVVNEVLQLGIPLTTGVQGGLLGAKRTGPGASEWMWIDGSPWNYTKWARGEPNNVNGGEFCIETYTDNPSMLKDSTSDTQKWNDASCGLTWRAAICKRKSSF